MSFENPGAPRPSKKETFTTKVRNEVDRLVEEGRLTKEQGEEKMVNAGKIEDGFSDNSEYDARQFAGAGVYTEQEMIDLLNEKE